MAPFEVVCREPVAPPKACLTTVIVALRYCPARRGRQRCRGQVRSCRGARARRCPATAASAIPATPDRAGEDCEEQRGERCGAGSRSLHTPLLTADHMGSQCPDAYPGEV